MMPQGMAWTQLKPKIAPPRKAVVRKHRDLFWYYVSERANIYRLRSDGHPFPWTDDPILKNYHFTNVQRKHDKGTKKLYELLDRTWDKHRKRTRIIPWYVIQYRLPNYHTLFEEYGWIPLKFNRKVWEGRIAKVKEKHGKWFTSAHIVLQSNFQQSRDKNYLDYLEGISRQYDNLCDRLRDADTMEKCFRLMKSYHGMGGFTAYEVMIDLCFVGVKPYGFLDEFANAGPGCKEGIDLIYPNREKLTYTQAMERLRDNQEHAFERLRLLPPPDTLTLQDIEFNLCEFSKYMKIKYDTGRKRRYAPA